MDALYIRIREEVLGPLDREAALNVFRERKLTPSHQVSHDGNDWFPAARIWEQLHAGAAPPPRIRVVSDLATPEPKPRPTGVHRKPPSAITAPPPPPTRSHRDAKSPSAVRPPSVELSADAKTPTADEIQLAPVRVGILQPLLSLLLVLALLGQLTSGGFAVHFNLRTLELFGELSNGTMLKVELDERRRELEQASNQASFGMLFGALAAFTLYCFWIYYTDGVLHRRRLRRLYYTRWWCVGWELIPLLNFWFPYLVLAEVWHGSTAQTKINWRGSMPLPIILYWVVKLACACAVPFLIYQAYSLAREYEEVRTTADVTAMLENWTDYLIFGLGYGIAGMVAYLLELIIVLRISWRIRQPRPAVEPASADVATGSA